MNSETPPADATVEVTCRYFAACQYWAVGPCADVTANYKQHLREQHQVAHPKVEAAELQATGALADFDRSPAVMAAMDPFPRAPMCGGQIVIEPTLPCMAFEAFREVSEKTIEAAIGLPPEVLDPAAALRTGLEFRVEYLAGPPRTAMCQLEPGAEPRVLDFQREGA